MKSPVAVSVASLLLLSVALAPMAFARGGDECKAAESFDALRVLEGTWVSTEPGQDGKPYELVFKLTANGTALVETMFPGAKHEMVNTYHLDNDKLLVTHYCAQGVQPRMKLTSHEGNTLKFSFHDCTNLKPGEGHMGGLELTIDGDRLVEKWTSLKDGKETSHMTFELKRKA
jgi:hypothetical protein